MDDITLKNLMRYAEKTYNDEDLQQEFYLGALEGKPSYLPSKGRLLTFLIRCGINKVTDYIRHNTRHNDTQH